MRTACGTILVGVAAVTAQVVAATPTVTAVTMSQPELNKYHLPPIFCQPVAAKLQPWGSADIK